MKRIAFALAALFLVFSARAENWPRFRGPTGQGVSAETDVPTKWSDTENVAWKTEIPGEGWSSPIVWEDHVFLTTATDNGVSCRVLCLDRKSGKILWNTKVFDQQTTRKEGRNSYATPTPVTDGHLVYAVFGSGGIAALDFAGDVAWTNRDNRFYSQHGLGASPILHGDLLILPFDWSNEGEDKRVGWQKPWDKSFVLALDTKTGKERYKAKRGLSRIAHVTPQIVSVDGTDQLVSGAGDVVQGFDPDTGEKIWEVRSQGEGVVPSIVAGKGVVYTASGFEKPTIRAVRLGGKGEVTATHIAWEQNKLVPNIPSMLLANDLLFAVKENGIAFCMNPGSGEILWQQKLKGTYAASPIFADGKIYFLSETALATIVEAAPTYKAIAENDLNAAKCQASPAVSQGNLFIRTDKHLYCIGTK